MDNALVIQPSQNRGLAGTLMNIEGALLHAAQENLDNYLVTSANDFTGAEKRAMVICEQLKLVNGMDLAAVMMRGKLVAQIRDEGLWTQHPQGYHSMDEMAAAQGISPSELSNSITFCEVIFPYLEQHGRSVPVMWEEIGKSNFRDLIPTLQGIITGHPSPRVEANVNTILNDTAASLRATRTANSDATPVTDDEVRASAITTLTEQGAAMTNTQLRGVIRPTRTPNVNSTVMHFENGSRTIIATMTEEQYLTFQRKVGSWVEPVEIDLPDDPRSRRGVASRIQEVRNIAAMLQGG